MPAGHVIQIHKYSRAPIKFMVEKNGAALDLTAYDTVQWAVKDDDGTALKVRGTDDECAYVDDGTDGQIQYSPPAGGVLKDFKLVLWLILNAVEEEYPGDSEIDVRVDDWGGPDPSP